MDCRHTPFDDCANMERKEIVVVDDGCTDTTSAIARPCESDSVRAVTQANQGAADWIQPIFGWKFARSTQVTLPRLKWSAERLWDKVFRIENQGLATDMGKKTVSDTAPAASKAKRSFRIIGTAYDKQERALVFETATSMKSANCRDQSLAFREKVASSD